MPSRTNNILSRSISATTPLSSLQSQVDHLVGGFVEQATDLRTLAAISAGGLAFRAGRVGLMGLGTGNAVQALSYVGGLGAEVSAFELTSRGIASLSNRVLGPAPLQPENPNLWRWSGSGGLRQGLLSSAVTFGALKSAGRLAQGENLLVQHLLQDSAMVMGHQASGALGMGPRPTGNLAEQFLHAEATTLQLGAGMALAQRVAPGIHSMERGLDLAIRDPVENQPSGQPIQFMEGLALGDPSENQPSGQPIQFMEGLAPATPHGTLGGLRPRPSSTPEAKDFLLMSVKHGQELAETGEEIGVSGFHPVTPRTLSTDHLNGEPARSEESGGTLVQLPSSPPAAPSEGPPSSRSNSSYPLKVALAASEARYNNLLKALPDPVLVLDPDGNFLHVQAERDDLLFLPASELIGRNIRDLPFSPELKEWGLGLIRRALETGERQREEYSVPWRDGTTHVQEARVVPDTLPDGSKAVLVVVRDVTREKRTEELNLAAERLEAHQRFSQGVAHDLNNLLQAVDSYARFGARNLQYLLQLMRLASQENFSENPNFVRIFREDLSRFHKALTRGGQAPEISASDQVRFMALQALQIFERMDRDQATVVQQTARILSLVSELKELGAKPREGPPFDLHVLLEEGQIRGILDRTENLEGQPESLIINLMPGPCRVLGRQDYVSRAIENLVVNARDAMEGRPERKLTITTFRTPVTEADLAQVSYPPIGPNVRPGDFAGLRVQDTGQGIDDATLRNIFEPFFSTKQRNKSNSSGSGLGLAIAQSVIQNMGGFIKVRSQPGVGTAFEIYLPAIDDPS